MKRLFFYGFLVFLFSSLIFATCHRRPPAIPACETTDLGLDTTFQYSLWRYNTSGDLEGVTKWQWGKKGDTLIVRGEEGFIGEDTEIYCFYFLPREGCLDYVKTSLYYMSDVIVLDPDGNVISGIDYSEYTEGPFHIQEYEPGIRLIAQVGPHRFWVELDRDNWFDASRCGEEE